MPRPLLTPSSIPTAVISRCLVYPDSPEWRAIINGLIAGAIYASDWQPYGEVTEQEAADRCQEMLLAFFEADECGVEVPTIYPTDFAVNGLFLEQTQGVVNYSGSPANSAAFGNYRFTGDPANGDEYAFRCLLAAGSYRFWLNYYRNTDCGKLDIVVNGEYFVQGFDMYGSGAMTNTYWTLECPDDGLYYVQMRVNGKHASSTSHRFRVGGVHIYQPLAGGV